MILALTVILFFLMVLVGGNRGLDSFFALVRERAALLAIQRYTILLSSAILVPVILGTVVFLAPSLSGAANISAVNGTSAQPASTNLVPTLVLCCQIYLVINAALSSALLALSETNPKRAALYFAICAPLSQIAFALASSAQGAIG